MNSSCCCSNSHVILYYSLLPEMYDYSSGSLLIMTWKRLKLHERNALYVIHYVECLSCKRVSLMTQTFLPSIKCPFRWHRLECCFSISFSALFLFVLMFYSYRLFRVCVCVSFNFVDSRVCLVACRLYVTGVLSTGTGSGWLWTTKLERDCHRPHCHRVHLCCNFRRYSHLKPS